jgi:cobalt/nickel transport system ATP-binding protein
MLATDGLWFSYQDEPTLKGLTLDFLAPAGHRAGGGERLREIDAVYESERNFTPATRGGAVAGKPLDYSKRGLLALRQQVATVFQDPDQQIFYTDIDSDIAFALRNIGVAEDEIARRTDDALTLVDAHSFRHQPIQCLSHGQKKRVAIAGALVQAKYLLLDEPTAGLDPSGRTQMIAIIQRIVAQGNHVVISSHDIDLIYEICDAVYVLRRGEMLAYGTPGEVFAQKAQIEQAGLTQPWLVKLHTELGMPLCKSEAEFLPACGKRTLRRRHDAGDNVPGNGIRCG